MAFKFPVPQPKKRRIELLENIPGLSSFDKNDFSSISKFANGSYGNISLVKKNGKTYAIKELGLAFSTREQKLIRKEGLLLYSLKGRENILEIHGYSPSMNALMLDYACFDFHAIQVNNCNNAHNMLEFLKICDDNGIENFLHALKPICTGVAAGLAVLHGEGIVHRDLKPQNILVSNDHYSFLQNEDEILDAWNQNPIKVHLTDFGESRAAMVQTKSLLTTSTSNLQRGTPVYMAPEIHCSRNKTAGLEEMKQMDIWAFAMVSFHILNPGASHPYELELDDAENGLETLRRLHQEHKLPKNIDEYETLQATVLKELRTLYLQCANFIPSLRPSASILSAIVSDLNFTSFPEQGQTFGFRSLYFFYNDNEAYLTN